jgi:hypothetical protein
MVDQREAVTKAPGTHVWRGLDDLAAVSDAALAVFMLGVLALLPPVWGLVRAWPWLWCAAPLGLLAALGDRCALRVDGAGVYLTLYRAWLPVKHRRYGLDAELELYQSWDAERPEGLVLTPAPFVRDEAASDCFGPHYSEARLRRVHDELARAIHAQRAATPARALPLRHPWLQEHLAVLELGAAERNGQGRLRRISVRAPLSTIDVTIPAGSACLLNAGDRFRATQRDDVLEHIELGADAALFDGLVARAGAQLSFDDAGRLSVALDAFASRVQLPDGPCVRGERVVFRARRPVGYTLAEPFRVGSVMLPAETAVVHFERRLVDTVAPISCRLGAPLVMPGYTLETGDSLYFDHDGRLESVYCRLPLQGSTGERLHRVDTEGHLVRKG